MSFNPAATLSSSAGHSSGIKQRILFVLLAIFIYRVGAHITIPGIDQVQLAKLFAEQQNGVMGFFNMFSGGALSRMTLFALGVMPYITASIIIQLMSAVVPSLEQLKKEGDLGRRKLSQYTRFATLFLSIFQALGMSRGLVRANLMWCFKQMLTSILWQPSLW